MGKFFPARSLVRTETDTARLRGFFQKWMWIFSSVEVSAAVRKARWQMRVSGFTEAVRAAVMRLLMLFFQGGLIITRM